MDGLDNGQHAGGGVGDGDVNETADDLRNKHVDADTCERDVYDGGNDGVLGPGGDVEGVAVGVDAPGPDHVDGDDVGVDNVHDGAHNMVIIILTSECCRCSW